VQSVRCEPSALSSCRADSIWPYFHIRCLSACHRLALGLDMETRSRLLLHGDRRHLRYARGIFAFRGARSRCVPEHYLVHHMVERRAWSYHGGSILWRRRGTRPFVGRCARALPRRDSPWSTDATCRAGLSTKPVGAEVERVRTQSGQCSAGMGTGKRLLLIASFSELSGSLRNHMLPSPFAQHG